MPRDWAKALSYLKRGAEKGDVTAMRILGMAYMAGDGVPKDLERAERLLSQAVAAGDGKSAPLLEAVRRERKRSAR